MKKNLASLVIKVKKNLASLVIVATLLVATVVLVSMFVSGAIRAFQSVVKIVSLERPQSAVAPEFRVCPGAKDIFPTLESPKDVTLQPNCWSGLVRLPERVNYLVENDSAAWMEYKFLDDSTARITDEEKWFANIPRSAFRLRGTDVAKIRIEPR